MTADDKLRSLFADAAPPERDAAFGLGVQQALARRRLWAGLCALCAWAAPTTALLWMLARWTQPVIFSAAPAMHAAAPTIVLAVTAVVWASRRMRPI